MTDYISREAAIAVIYGQHIGGKEACENARPNTYGADLREIVADIEDIPAADVREVVLCRDCEHYQADCGWCGYFDIGMNVNDFCSRWKKREEN